MIEKIILNQIEIFIDSTTMKHVKLFSRLSSFLLEAHETTEKSNFQERVRGMKEICSIQPQRKIHADRP